MVVTDSGADAVVVGAPREGGLETEAVNPTH
jgi:hypothetical protein